MPGEPQRQDRPSPPVPGLQPGRAGEGDDAVGPAGNAPSKLQICVRMKDTMMLQRCPKGGGKLSAAAGFRFTYSSRRRPSGSPRGDGRCPRAWIHLQADGTMAGRAGRESSSPGNLGLRRQGSSCRFAVRGACC